MCGTVIRGGEWGWWWIGVLEEGGHSLYVANRNHSHGPYMGYDASPLFILSFWFHFPANIFNYAPWPAPRSLHGPPSTVRDYLLIRCSELLIVLLSIYLLFSTLVSICLVAFSVRDMDSHRATLTIRRRPRSRFCSVSCVFVHLSRFVSVGGASLSTYRPDTPTRWHQTRIIVSNSIPPSGLKL